MLIPETPITVDVAGHTLNQTQLRLLNSKINFGDGVDSCWLWQGCLRSNGYGVTGYSFGSRNNQKLFLVHRLVYAIFNKKLVDNLLSIHHNCSNKNCCNPQHLESMSQSWHTKISQFGNVKSLKTHCIKGHAFDSMSWCPGGSRRYCYICKAEREAKRRARIKQTSNLAK